MALSTLYLLCVQMCSYHFATFGHARDATHIIGQGAYAALRAVRARAAGRRLIPLPVIRLAIRTLPALLPQQIEPAFVAFFHAQASSFSSRYRSS